MSDWNFGEPSGQGDMFKTADYVGSLVAFVDGKRGTQETKFGEAEVTTCRYVVLLDGDDAGTVFDDPTVFGNIGKDAYSVETNIVLGRINVGEAKPGRNAPFILDAATDDDKKVAGAWFDKNAAINSVGAVLIG